MWPHPALCAILLDVGSPEGGLHARLLQSVLLLMPGMAVAQDASVPATSRSVKWGIWAQLIEQQLLKVVLPTLDDTLCNAPRLTKLLHKRLTLH